MCSLVLLYLMNSCICLFCLSAGGAPGKCVETYGEQFAVFGSTNTNHFRSRGLRVDDRIGTPFKSNLIPRGTGNIHPTLRLALSGSHELERV
jgi:hypothetical protein